MNEKSIDNLWPQPLLLGNHYPVSPAQKRFCFLFELNPDNVNYNLGIYAKIGGKLNTEILEKSLDILFENNLILRTTFGFEEGQAFQVIHSIKPVELVRLDYSEFSSEEQERLLENYKSIQRNKPFDLEKGPLTRQTLIRLNENTSLFHFCAHHVIIDGFSLVLFLKQLCNIYESLLQSVESAVEKPPMQYVEYAMLLNEQLESTKYLKQMNYWIEKLKDAPRTIQLPTDFTRQRDTNYLGATYRFQIDSKLKQKIDFFSKKNNKTPYHIFLAVYAILLHKYSGDSDINIGTYLTNRSLSKAANLIGMFVNTLVIRLGVAKNLSFCDFLEEERQVVLEALDHQSVSFENVIEHLNIERDLSRNPLFQVNFNYLPNLMKAIKVDDLHITPVDTDIPKGEFDWSFEILDSADHYEVYFQYNSNLFKEESIKRAAGHFLQLLQTTLNHPEKIISDLSLLTPEETKMIVDDWNPSPIKYALDKTVPILFEEAVNVFTDKTAVIFGDDSLSYQALNDRVNQLAHYLLKFAIQPGQCIGVSLSRGIDMVVAVIAVMKIGCTYIPLDPAFPIHRLDYMVENSELPVLITSSELHVLFPKYKKQFIFVDKEKSIISKASRENVNITINSHELAYMIYTSGSTGNPKGVQIEHRSLTNFLFSMQEKPGIKDRDVLLAVTTLSFDIAALELYLPLITGATLVIAPETAKQDVFELQTLMDTHRVTLVQATPTTWQMLFESGWKGDPDLVVLCGGEAIKLDLARKLTASCKALWNMYGPTETTIWSSVEKIEPAFQQITIGRPIANTSFYILDESLQPVPIGLMGKLHIGGVGVARGYLKRPDLTAEKFIQNPFTQNPADRIYDTGDLARYLPDGRVECLGRADYQVKVRGFRLELGDIEANLAELEEVKDAVVVLQDERLIAYIIPNNSMNIEQLENQLVFSELLRNKLKNVLPSYMMPAAFVTIEHFPLTPNKKIDRNALPKPEVILTGADFIAPRDDTEHKLAVIWEALLGHQPISVTSDYFDCGGNSLLSISLISRVNSEFNLQLPLAVVFNYSTIERMAQYINAKKPQSLQSLVVIRKENARAPVVLAHPIGGHIACYTTLIKYLESDHAIYALQHPGVYSDSIKHRSISSLAEYYASEVHHKNPKGEMCLLGWSFGGLLAFEMARFFELWGHPISKLILVDTFVPTVFKKDIYPKTKSPEKLLWYFIQDYLGLNAKNTLSEDEFLRLLGDKVDVHSALQLILKEQLPNSPQDVKTLERAYAVFLDNLKMYWSYQPEPLMTNTIVVASSHEEQLPTRGWDAFATGNFTVEKIAADHFSLLKEPYVNELANIIKNK